tara:strand:+ start:577 stop:1371 length:795 start_codon:yes stop_codon:yes gene_type:complete
MSVPFINIDNINYNTFHEIQVPNVFVPSWMYRHPNVDHLVPPVVVNIGNPIIDMPGCVEMHKDNQYHKSGLPVDRNLIKDDPDQAIIVCDAEVPSYDAMNYEPEQLIITREAPVPNVAPPPEVDPPEVPDTGNVTPEETPCPAPNQPRVGDLTQAGDERVIGHELQGTTCVVLYEPTTAVEKFLPSTNQVSTTAAIAIVATASAAATPLLLRVIKPIIKKATDFVKKKLGKKIYKPSREEIRANQYRQSKGLSPLNFEKMKKKG